MSAQDQEFEGEVSTRVHHLIRSGKIPLPVSERGEITQKKQELEIVLTLLMRTYVQLVCARRLDDASDLLAVYRGLGEADLSAIFERWGYPDERSEAPDSELWLALAKAVGGESTGADAVADGGPLSRVDADLVSEWREAIQSYSARTS